MADSRSEAAELIADLNVSGVSSAQIARQLGRSPSWVSLIRRGKRPGDSMVPALRELQETGRIADQPPRRRRADGKMAKVRAPKNKTVTPPKAVRVHPEPTPKRRFARQHPKTAPKRAPGIKPTPSTAQPAKRAKSDRPAGRTRFDAQRVRYGPSRWSDIIRAPKRGQVGRHNAGQALLDSLSEGAQKGKRVSITAWVDITNATGGTERRRVVLGGKGGYDAALAYNGIMGQDQPEDGLGWVESQIDKDRYEISDAVGGWSVVQVDVDTWGLA